MDLSHRLRLGRDISFVIEMEDFSNVNYLPFMFSMPSRDKRITKKALTFTVIKIGTVKIHPPLRNSKIKSGMVYLPLYPSYGIIPNRYVELMVIGETKLMNYGLG